MSYYDKKEELKELVEVTFEKLKTVLPESSQIKILQGLLDDINEDSYTIMVVGEFKHGKSTFINALLGLDVMPRGVTPTTATINTVHYGTKQKVEVFKTDASVQQFNSVSVLNQYIAEEDFDFESIKYIKLEIDSELLKDNVILIDTPGVNDLSEQRSEVTHQFLPRADVVIFMSSLTSPIKQSEEKFIKERMKKIGLDRVIFAANFMDSIDEEELDELLEFVERRLEGITGESLKSLYPISAIEALEGRLKNDNNLLKYSGLPELEKEIHNRIQSSSRGEEKIRNFTSRLIQINEVIIREIDTTVIASSQSLEELEMQLDGIKQWFNKLSSQETELQNYLYDRETEINFMIGKSLRHFEERLKNDIETRIHTFQGADIKSLVENQLPMIIKSQFTMWIDQYEDSIQQLLLKLEKEVSQGLARSFNQSIQLQNKNRESFNHLTTIPIFEAKSGNANVKAGMILGGVSSIALLIGAPFFLPIVGMAGLPLISQKIAEKQLETVKPELIMSVRQKINEMIKSFESQLQFFVKDAINDINDISTEEFNRLLYSYEVILRDEVEKHRYKTSDLESKKKKLYGYKDWILQNGGREIEYGKLG